MKNINKFNAVCLVLCAIALSGCYTTNGNKSTIGFLGGAALGGWLGSTIGGGTGQLAATAAGALIGGLVGQDIGTSMDRSDQLYMNRATYSALEYAPAGQYIPWYNINTRRSGNVIVQNTYTVPYGAVCRDFRQTVEINGRTEILVGTACRNSSGSWTIQ